MMITYFKTVVAVLTVGILVTHGLICQFPHCETVQCESVDADNCTGTIRMGGGYCGCCMVCFTQIGYLEPCVYKDALDELLYPPTAICNPGLYCDRKSSTCQSIPGVG
ncbi:uncharacterized protein LOC132727200 [Ruditapes philippinarum]|uniref:uncharacterized protein LOC132727200 n=1 Tax=Ruditapes philippinarum TaxID=129788 RepID=UPI00295BB474|nr:uncharacterized protein LOC132727200 [Ruditapes philippinarum]